MNKQILSSFIIGMAFLTANASPLSPQQALSRIEDSMAGASTRSLDSNLSLKLTLKGSDELPSVYVFDKNENSGFIVASADDQVLPVLGYSDHGNFDPNNIPPELNYWLNEYSRQIDYVRTNGYSGLTTSSQAPFSGMNPISPLVPCKWNQGAPYNDYCYTIAADGSETKSVTGCVATSMAQVMYYFKYPEIGHGEISYKHDDSGVYSMNFGEKAFAWNDMLPTYYPGSYTQTQADAVAYLMKACGYSVKMDYGKGESGASGTAISGALIEYFGYNNAIQVQTRAFRTYNDWAQMIYDNLQKVGPVVYNGSALDGGHSFVCDGYDGNGYFHFNWGWGGMSDGYYLLDALNPDEFGIGGAAGGYNLGQQVILNITPDTPLDIPVQLMQFGNVTGKISDGHLSLELKDASDPGFQYINPLQIQLTFGLEVANATNPTQEVQYFESEKQNLPASQGSFFRWDEDGLTLDLSSVEMTEGDDYNFTVATNIKSSAQSGWTEVVAQPGKANYLTITKDTDGYHIKDYSVNDIAVSDFKIESSPVYFNRPVKFSAQFTNNCNDQLTRNYSAVFFDAEGTELYKMENYSINVDANESLPETWTSVEWYKENGAEDITEATEFTVKLYDNWTGAYVEGIEVTTTVYPPLDEGKVESSFTIVNGKKEGDIYVIDGNELEVSLTLKVTEGTFNHTVMLAVQMPLESGEYYTIMHKHFDAIPDLSAGEEQMLDMSVILEDIYPDTIYRVEVWGEGSGFNEKLLVKFNTGNSSVVNRFSSQEGQYKVYRLDGTFVTEGSFSDIVNKLSKGIYIINGKKIVI